MCLTQTGCSKSLGILFLCFPVELHLPKNRIPRHGRQQPNRLSKAAPPVRYFFSLLFADAIRAASALSRRSVRPFARTCPTSLPFSKTKKAPAHKDEHTAKSRVSVELFVGFPNQQYVRPAKRHRLAEDVEPLFPAGLIRREHAALFLDPLDDAPV
jgi:hypothetical protein